MINRFRRRSCAGTIFSRARENEKGRHEAGPFDFFRPSPPFDCDVRDAADCAPASTMPGPLRENHIFFFFFFFAMVQVLRLIGRSGTSRAEAHC
jgi:hypothetical protein